MKTNIFSITALPRKPDGVPSVLISPRRASFPVKLPTHIVSRPNSPVRVALRSTFDGVLRGSSIGASPLPDCLDSMDQATRSCSSYSCPCSPTPSVGRTHLSSCSTNTSSTCLSSCQAMHAKMKEEVSSECLSMCARMKEEMCALSQRMDEITSYFVSMEQVFGSGVVGPLLEKGRKDLEKKLAVVNEISDPAEIQGLIDAAVRLGLSPKFYAPFRERQSWLESGSKKDSLIRELEEIRTAGSPPKASSPEALQQLIDDCVRLGIEAKTIRCAREMLKEFEDIPKTSAVQSSVTDLDLDRVLRSDLCHCDDADVQQWLDSPAPDLERPQEISFEGMLASDRRDCQVLATQKVESHFDAVSPGALFEGEFVEILSPIAPCVGAKRVDSTPRSSPGAKRIDSSTTHGLDVQVSTVVFKEPFTFSESGMLDDVNLQQLNRSSPPSPFERERCEPLNSVSPQRGSPQYGAIADEVVLDLSNVLDGVHASALVNSLEESMRIDESFDGAPPLQRPQPSPATIFFPTRPSSPLAFHAGELEVVM